MRRMGSRAGQTGVVWGERRAGAELWRANGIQVSRALKFLFVSFGLVAALLLFFYHFSAFPPLPFAPNSASVQHTLLECASCVEPPWQVELSSFTAKGKLAQFSTAFGHRRQLRSYSHPIYSPAAV